MKELERLQEGLGRSSTLLLKDSTKGLECSFIKEGIEIDHFLVKDKVLANALAEAGEHGIVEGSNFNMLKNNYGWFSLRVKSKRLFQELQQPAGSQFLSSSVAEPA